ncbi:MAG TPA: flagellar hook capping FlgD N-terminal domain-containing protein [Caulobacteraceae bacterium]|jgi:flagellar basal-body rod modification protein FlgD|nr:flagellar hook capping FlgD N-terminal domain-containing protein [Caulobacteraceae bacterium]
MTTAPVSATSSSQSAFGLNFQSLLQIILQQLQYQDPLKPMDNFEFVSQLAQFSQLEQSQTLNDSVNNLLSAQSSMQATALLGQTIVATTDSSTLTGVVTSVTFSAGTSALTVRTSNGQTVANIPLSGVTEVVQTQ